MHLLHHATKLHTIPPLVLISGLLSNHTVWKHQLHHLKQLTSIHIVSPRENTPENMVQEVLRQAPPRFAMAGHSMGGWLCLEIMRLAPHRVVKLCLLNTTARSDSDEKKAKRKEMITRAQQGCFHEIVDEITSCFVHVADVKEDVKNMFLQVGKDVFIQQEESMIRRQESLSILPTIDCPTLVIHAAQDNNFSLVEHEDLVAQIARATLAVVEDAGHMSPMEMPQAVTALLRYWLTWF